jgi:opacity protein-like surface antigen
MVDTSRSTLLRSTLALAVVALVASGCATAAGGRQPQPLAHEGDAPIAFTALGARYSVPPRFAITDHDKEPGVAWFDYTDQNTGCRGSVVFITTSDRARASGYVTNAMKKDVEGFQRQGIAAQVRPTTEPMLGENAQVQVADLTSTDDKAAKAHFGAFIAEQQLVVVGEVFCRDPGLLEPQLHTLAQVVNSQKSGSN